jgi:hypothetical protein
MSAHYRRLPFGRGGTSLGVARQPSRTDQVVTIPLVIFPLLRPLVAARSQEGHDMHRDGRSTPRSG